MQYSIEEQRKKFHALYSKKYEKKKIEERIGTGLAEGWINKEHIEQYKKTVHTLEGEIVLLEKQLPRPLTHDEIRDMTEIELPHYAKYCEETKKKEILILFLPKLIDIETAMGNYDIFSCIIKYAFWKLDHNNKWQYHGWKYLWEISNF